MEHTLELIRLSQMGENEAKEQLIEENSGLIWSIVRRYLNRGYEAEDLYQIGAIGLIRAIDKFDFSYEVKFSTYAVPLISGEIKRFLRDDGMIKVSRTLKENKWKIQTAAEKIRNREGREPTLEEIAEEVSLEVEDVVLSLEAQTEVDSIDEIIYQGDGNAISLGDRIADQKDAQEEMLNRLLLEQLLETLEERERKLITLRYFENMPQIRVAEQLHISQVQVSRMEKKILLRMREQMMKN
ncbi:MAG: SigB/SigF/SigG family RNA polymerase sigma factor [Lachnospiraceae bacterium]